MPGTRLGSKPRGPQGNWPTEIGSWSRPCRRSGRLGLEVRPCRPAPANTGHAKIGQRALAKRLRRVLCTSALAPCTSHIAPRTPHPAPLCARAQGDPMVRRRGLEPPRGCPHQPLKLTRLPVPPPPHAGFGAGTITKPAQVAHSPSVPGLRGRRSRFPFRGGSGFFNADFFQPDFF